MLVPLLIGAVFGLSLLLVGRAVVPARADLAAQVGRWESRRAARSQTEDAGGAGGVWAGLVGRFRQWLALRGVTFAGVRPDLALMDRSLEAHLSSKLGWALAGLLTPSAIVAIWAAVGLAVPWTMPAVAGLMLAAVGFVAPDASLTREASERRRELRWMFSSYLDLVQMSLVGGRGASQALWRSAHLGNGWGFDLLRSALQRARDSGMTEWDAFIELGERTKMPELVELGSALSLVAGDGAKVTTSLTARAETMRARRLAEAEGDAKNADQSMTLAQLLPAFGIILFLGFPALSIYMSI